MVVLSRWRWFSFHAGLHAGNDPNEILTLVEAGARATIKRLSECLSFFLSLFWTFILFQCNSMSCHLITITTRIIISLFFYYYYLISVYILVCHNSHELIDELRPPIGRCFPFHRFYFFFVFTFIL